MASAEGNRIECYCKIIWGRYDYDLELESDGDCYVYVVRKDFGSSFGDPLTITYTCNSEKRASEELERMLKAWAEQVQSGQRMTEAQELEIFGGPNGECRRILRQFRAERERRAKSSI